MCQCTGSGHQAICACIFLCVHTSVLKVIFCVCVCARVRVCSGPGRRTDGTLGNRQEGREPQQESLWQHHRL